MELKLTCRRLSPAIYSSLESFSFSFFFTWIQHQTNFITTKSKREPMVTPCQAYLFWMYILQDLKLMPTWTYVSKQALLFFRFTGFMAIKQQPTCLHAAHAFPCPLSVFQSSTKCILPRLPPARPSPVTRFLCLKSFIYCLFFFLFASMIKYITGNPFILRDHIFSSMVCLEPGCLWTSKKGTSSSFCIKSCLTCSIHALEMWILRTIP